MGYRVLARRYRPQNFDEVIGQEHISQTLQNSISTNRIAHAFLFSGPRGVGKTTMARILAKALNCKTGPAIQPCNQCISCREITEGRSLDVLEIDGASNRGIDEIRALKENVKFTPSSNRYKIYIIDEVHMLTTDAFNALLKTLEEPPGHIIFIMATTEPHKVIATILSRCQRFNFRLIPWTKIKNHLNAIIEKETFSVQTEAVDLIAKKGEGSLRDALTVFEQVLSLSEGEIKYDDVMYLLGILPQEMLLKFSDLIAENNVGQILSLLNNVLDTGFDIHQLTGDLKQYFRNLLMAKISEDKTLLEGIADKDIENIEKKKELFSVERIVYILELLSGCQNQMKWSDHPKLIFEMTLIKMGRAYVSIEEIINKLSDFEQKIGTEQVTKKEYEYKEEEKKGVEEKKPQQIKVKETKESNYEVQNKKEIPDNKKKDVRKESNLLKDKWEQVIDTIGTHKESVGTFLRKGQIQQVDERDIVLEFSKENEFYLKGVEKNKTMISEVIEEIVGERYRLKCVVNEAFRSEEILEKTDKKEMPVEPQIQKIIDMFDGRVIKRAN